MEIKLETKGTNQESLPIRAHADKWAEMFYQHHPKLSVSDVIMTACEEWININHPPQTTKEKE